MERSERLAGAIAAHKSGDLRAAESTYEQLLQEDAEDAEALNAYGILHLQCERPDAALDCFEKAAELAPRTAKYQSNIAGTHLALKHVDVAIAHFARAVELEPDNADYRANLATARMNTGDAARAEEDFGQALALDPDHYQARQNLGGLLSRLNRPGDALPHLERAANNPDRQIETVFHLASTYERLNRLDEAANALQQTSEPMHPWARILGARLLRRNGDAAAGLAVLRTGEAPDGKTWVDEMTGNWHHELALCGDQAGETDGVFENLLAAKAHWRKADGNRDGADYLNRVRRARRSVPDVGSSKRGTPGDMPPLVFFAGFPRSGTTLMEAMLGAHPDVATIDEAEMLSPLLDDDGKPAPADAPEKYLTTLRQHAGEIGPGTTVVDKLPLNLIHCRAIDAMFPEARLLVALRDPRDVVLSCLMQRFRRNPAMRNFDTLDEAVTLYEEVMGLWLDARRSLSLPWLEYRYEDLVADQDATVDRVLDFIGIERHPTMDDYREQAASREVTTPSYRGVTDLIYSRSVGHWHAYETHLEPVLERLAPFVEAFGYEA